MFHFFWIFVLFEVIFLLKLVSFLSKSVLPTKSISYNLAVKFSFINLLNSGVVTHLA